MLSKPCGNVCGGLKLSWSGSAARRIAPPSSPRHRNHTNGPYEAHQFRIIARFLPRKRCGTSVTFLTPPRADAGGNPVSRLRSSVGWKLVLPEPSPDLSDLIASLLAQRVCGEQVVVVTVVEHLERFER